MPTQDPKWRHSKRWNLFLPDFGFGIEVCQHSELTDEQLLAVGAFPCSWNTYLLFCDRERFTRDGKICDRYVENDPVLSALWAFPEGEGPLYGLEGWNGGVTLEERTVSATGVRKLKIGDDYNHSWDRERFDMFDLVFMQRKALATAAEFAALGIPSPGAAQP